MGQVKEFRHFIAEKFVEENKGLIDLDKGFVLADELWDKACDKDKKATIKLGKLVNEYKKQRNKA